ncbi:hypothetical protein [Amycolatopsis antarctica]|nr:hypothetical protein [Amycolatopsis antarctica]
MTTPPNGHRTRGGTLRRLGALALATAATFAGTAVAGAGTANADTINCWDAPGEWTPDPANPTWGWGNYRWYQYEFSNPVVTPAFNVSDTRIVTNQLGEPVTATFTSQQSQTFSIDVGATMTAKLTEFLTASVSSSITRSRTTSIGVATTAPVPARTTVKGEYGVEAFDVTYDVKTYQRGQYPGLFGGITERCHDDGPDTRTTNAPTVNEGWRISAV